MFMVIGVVGLLLISLASAAEPTVVLGNAGRKNNCDARGSAMSLEVRCPTTTVADLLGLLQRTAGLRSEYPKELASTRVSVNLSRASLLEVLESALSAFNFAVWIDHDSPSVTWLRIVDMRGAGERPDQPRAYEQTARSSLNSEPVAPSGGAEIPTSSPGAEPTSSAVLVPVSNEADMAWEREKFARTITTTYPLEPGPADAGGGMQPATINSADSATPRTSP